MYCYVNCVLIGFIVFSSHHFVTSEERLGNEWVKLTKIIGKLSWPIKTDYINILNSVLAAKDIKLSSECSYSLRLQIIGLKKEEEWAIRMMDSLGLPKRGINGLGDYDQCLDIHVKKKFENKDNETDIYGQYCNVILEPPRSKKFKAMFDFGETSLANTFWDAKFTPNYHYFQWMNIVGAVCVPSTCSRDEIEIALKVVFSKYSDQTIKLGKYCDTKTVFKELEMTPKQTYAWLILKCLMVFVAFCTLFIYYFPVGDSLTYNIIQCFSLVKNTQKLFVESKDPTTKKLGSIHGIRMIQLLFTIGSHVYLCGFWAGHVFTGIMDYHPDDWLAREGMTNIGVGVSVTMGLSGLLTFYTWYPIFVQNKGNVSFIKYIIPRWFRTTPAIAGMMLTHYLWPTMGSGPMFRETAEKLVGLCDDYWYANLLYYNNWLSPLTSCLPHTWYMSADFQLYIISFFVMTLLIKKPKFGIALGAVIMLLGPIITGIVVHVRELPPTANLTGTDYSEIDRGYTLHSHTYAHMYPYFGGILFGYMLTNVQPPKSKLFWITGWAILPLVMYIPWIIGHLRRLRGQTRLEEIIYAVLQRPIFLISQTWIVYACFNNYGGIIHSIYSSNFLIPFSRMSFSIFIGHFLVIWFDLFTRRTSVSFRHFDLAMQTLNVTTVCVIFGWFLYILFEAPFINLMKVILSPKPIDKSSSNNNENYVSSEQKKIK